MFIRILILCVLFWITSHKVAGDHDEYSPNFFAKDSNYLSKLLQDVLLNKTDTIFLNEDEENVVNLDCNIIHLNDTFNKEIFTDTYNEDAINNLLLNKTDSIILYGVYNNNNELIGLNCRLYKSLETEHAGGHDEYSPNFFTKDPNYLSKLLQDVLLNKTDKIFPNEGEETVVNLDCKIIYLNDTFNKEIFTDTYNQDAINNLFLNKTDSIILYGVYNNSDELIGLNCRLNKSLETEYNLNKKKPAKPVAKPTAKPTATKSTTKSIPHKDGHDHSDKVFHVGKNEIVLFKSLHIADTCNMWMAFFIVFILAFVNEFLKPCTAYLCCSDVTKDPEFETSNRRCGLRASKKPNDCECYKSCLERFYRFLFRMSRYILQVFISYILMMIIMTMNIWLFFAVILGATTGYASYSSTCRKSLFTINNCSNPCC